MIAVLISAITFGSCNLTPDNNTDSNTTDHEHVYREWSLENKPTCDTIGERARYCDCGNKQTAPVPQLDHSYDEDQICLYCGKSKASNSNGSIDNETGSNNGAIDCSHDHTATIKGSSATCLQNGVSDFVICSDCGTVITPPVTIKVPHNYVNGVCVKCDTVCAHNETIVVEGYPSGCSSYGLSDGRICKICGFITEKQVYMPLQHDFEDGVCKKCNVSYPQSDTKITIRLYGNTNNGDLSSGLKKYCAGNETTGTVELDNLIVNRNLSASQFANVTYQYENNYTLGGSVEDISTLTKSGSDETPDVFMNFVYDMTYATLRGCFANLYSNTKKSTSIYGAGENHFAFTKDNYNSLPLDPFDPNSNQGYLIDYMQSLTFANELGEYDKMYCLASNYTLDAIRAMTVVPVNVEMLEGISLEASTGDLTGDGTFDIEDFYTLVWNYDWTYEALARLSKAVFRNDNTAIPGADIKDTLGFCAGKSSGLTASGIVYTTSVKIINKVQKEGKWTYEYPARNYDLVALSDALYDLFKNNTGVCTLDSADAKQLFAGAESDLDGIRNRFAKNKLLFGGVITVGSLEDSVYQQLNAPGKSGFGFVPVPLYKQTNTHTEKYNTHIYNLGRIAAISKTTTKFEQCSAFLNYQSTHSANILEKYCENELIASINANDAIKQNVKMLTYIRNHVSDCFDKTYEDVISDYQKVTDAQSSSKRWHGIFYSNGYMVDNMDQRYAEESPAKQEQLITILDQWARLK